MQDVRVKTQGRFGSAGNGVHHMSFRRRSEPCSVRRQVIALPFQDGAFADSPTACGGGPVVK